jgi:capsular polysaccharide biosynthesis protein
MISFVKKYIRKTLIFSQSQLAFLISRLSSSSITWGPPKGFYSTIHEYLEKSKATVRQIFPATGPINYLPLPVTNDDNIHWRFLKNDTGSFPIQSVIEIPKGRVLGDRCIIITEDDKILGEVSREFGINGDLSKLSVFRKIRLPKCSYFDGELAVIGYVGWNNYWHWTFDILPRIYLLHKSGHLATCDGILVNELLFPFQRESLIKMGLPEEKIIYAGKDTHIMARKLLVPTIPEAGDHVPAWSIRFLQEKLFFDQSSGLQHSNDSKIFISRGKARNRRLVNETEIYELLSGLGFTKVVLEDLSLKEQAEIFKSASVIIAPHGASQTNLIHSRRGTKVIELFSPLWINYCFWSLAVQMGIHYYYLMGEGPVIDESNYRIDKTADIHVDMKKLITLLQKAGLMESVVNHTPPVV